MKSLLLSLALIVSTTSFAQDAAEGVTIEVTIDNVTSNEGKVIIALHTSETFMAGQGIKNSESKITDGKVSVTFTNVKPGTYAVMALHDQNENNRMDFEPNGMPKENYGSSNNPMSFGPPQFSESKFDVGDENIKMNIRF